MQQALLKILEGEKIFVPLNVTAHWNKYDYVEIDISNILFICAGSFSDMVDASDGKPIGFFNEGAADSHEVSTDDLNKYGFLPELLAVSRCVCNSTRSLPTISSRSSRSRVRP